MAVGLVTGFTPIASSPGLQVTINAGDAVISNSVVRFPKGDISLVANTTNYVFLNFSAGQIQSNTTGFPASVWPICTARTNSRDCIAITDVRPDIFGGSGGSGTTLGINAADYGVTGNGHFSFNAVTSVGSQIVTCSDGGFLTNATVGQIVFATSLSRDGFSTTTVVVVPQGTITSIDSDTQIHVSLAATATSNPACLVWGDDQSTALTNAWNACKTSVPSALVLPGLNPQKNGPAVILVQSAQLNSTASIVGTGGSRDGLGVCGGGVNATFIVPTPNFDFTSTVNNVCFLNVSDGAYFHDFTIWGAGVSNPGPNLNSKIAAQITCANNAKMHDVALIAWGANQTNGIGVGLKVVGGEIMLERVDCDMFGGVGCQCTSGNNLGEVFFSQCTFWDNGYVNLYIDGAGTGKNPVWTVNCNFGNAGQGVTVNGSGIWHDIGSIVGLPGTAQAGFGNAVLLGYTTIVTGTTSGGIATAYLIGTQIDCFLSSGGHCLYLDNATCTALLSSCIVKDESAGGSAFAVTNNGGLTDAGGSSFASLNGTLYSGTGKIYGALSITGAVQTAGNIATTSGWGTSPSVGSVSGNSRLMQFTITVGTTPGADPVVTVTFPKRFLVAPICRATQVGGTQAVSNLITGAVSATSAAFTWKGTPTGGNTIVIVVEADLP